MVDIDIDIKPLDYSIERFIRNRTVKKGKFDEIKEDLIVPTQKEVKKRFNMDASLELVVNIRNAYVREKIVFKHKDLKKMAKRLCREFKSGKTIVQLSDKYDFSPLSMIRQILILLHKINKKNVKDFMKDPKKIKDSKLRKQTQKILDDNLDIFANPNNEITAQKAEGFEVRLGEVLTELGVKFRTQEELVAEQTEQLGKPVNTPDFLIESDFTINGHQIKWIDAKHFFGASTWITRFSIGKQIKKYTDTWGYGALVFSLGFSSKLEKDVSQKNSDVMMIDFNSLPHSQIQTQNP